MTLRNSIRIALFAAAGAAAPLAARGGLVYTGSTVLENFDEMPSSASATPLNATVGTVNAGLGGSSFDGTKTSGTGTTLNLNVDNGTSNAGALYDYGATSSTDRALGSLASGSNVPAFGVAITNNSGAPLVNPTLTFNREQWRSSTSTQNILAFAAGLSGGTATTTNYLTDSSLVANTAFDLVGDAPVTTNGAVDGNSDSTLVTGTLPITVPDGATLFLRWSDTNDVGNDAGLAIDNFSLSSSASTPEPTALGLIAIAGAGLFGRRRRNA